MPIPVGARLGPYEVLSPLGAGGMGEVYRARDTRLDRHVALKIVGGPAADDPMFRERFQREARMVSRLSHPAICPLFDVGEQDGRAYLVMECLEGETLAARLARGPLGIDAALHIAIQIADGLAHAHGAGIVHRDLKPGNVMVQEGDRVRILDFGLARRFATDSADATLAVLTESGMMAGTVAYMSPEQIAGSRVDHRSDIFSFGVMLYEMLAGVRPFEGGNTFSVMQKIVSYVPPAPDFIRPAVPKPLGELLTRMLVKSPAERLASARDVAVQLRAIAGMPTASAAPLAVALPQSRRGRRRLAAGVLAAAVLIAATMAIAVPSWRRAVTTVITSRAFPRPAAAGESGGTAPLPRTAVEWTTQGRAYLRRYDRVENVDRAIDAFQRAIQLDASHAAAHAGLAEAFVRKDTAAPDAQWIRQANESARRSVALNGDLAAAHAALGVVLLRAKQAGDGRKALERALDLDPLNVSAHIGLGEYHLSHGEAARAEAVYRRAIQAAPAEWQPLQQLGRSLYAQAKYADAARAWEEAERKSPDNVVVLRNLGAVYHMLDRTDEAANALQRALEIQPTATVYSNLGTLRFFQGRYSDAAAAFEQAVERNATYYLYWGNLGDAYRWVPGSAEKARTAYARAVSLLGPLLQNTPNDPDLRTQLCVYLAKHGDRAGAIRQLQPWQALPAATKTPASYFRALLVHELAGDRDEALRHLELALRAGYSIKEILGEPELTKLRSDARYHRIVAAFEASSATRNGVAAHAAQ